MWYSSIKDKLGKVAKIFALSGLIFGGSEGQSSVPQPLVKSDTLKTKTVVKKDTVAHAVQDITYTVDTLSTQTSTLMYWCKGKIVRNYIENNNSFRLQMPYVAHEDWHDHNAGYDKYALTLNEYFKLSAHDEISANLLAILTARYEYLSSNDKESVIKKYQNSYMKFYFDAVANGDVKPESRLNADRDAEWKLLANGTRDMWMRRYFNTYLPRFWKKVDRFDTNVGLRQDKKGYLYKKFLKNKYFIGGVDFLSYMDKDISFDDKFLTLTDYMIKSEALLQAKGIGKLVRTNYERLSDINLEQRREAFQHLFIAGLLKDKLHKVDAENLKSHPQIVTSCYYQVIHKLQQDKVFKSMADLFPKFYMNKSIVQSNDSVYQNFLTDIYTHEGVDMRDVIQNFSVKKVPVKESVIFDANDLMMQPWLAVLPAYQDMQIEKMRENSEAARKRNKKQQKTDEVEPSEKVRKSEEQHILIPNFREPILVANTPEQDAEIFKVMQDFEKIPAVLKGCNTEAQKKYWQEQKALTRRRKGMEK